MLNIILEEGVDLKNMNNTEIYNKLKEIIDPSNIKINESMKNHTSFKIGGNADFFVIAKTIDDIKNILKFSKDNNINLNVIGNGSNILVTDKGIRGIVIKIDLQEIEIQKRIEDVADNIELEKVAEEGEIYSYNEVIIKADSRSKTWKTSTEFF